MKEELEEYTRLAMKENCKKKEIKRKKIRKIMITKARRGDFNTQGTPME